MASAVNSIFGSTATGAASGASSGAASSSSISSTTPSEGVFLKLLVSQIQNQDPLNPSDSTQFVTQLAQFSQLEQVIGIRNDIESGQSAAAAATSGAATSSTQSAASSAGTTSNPFSNTSTSSTTTGNVSN